MNILNAWSILSEKDKKYWLTVFSCQQVYFIRCATWKIDGLFRLYLKFGKKNNKKYIRKVKYLVNFCSLRCCRNIHGCSYLAKYVFLTQQLWVHAEFQSVYMWTGVHQPLLSWLIVSQKTNLSVIEIPRKKTWIWKKKKKETTKIKTNQPANQKA